ncbi:MAG: sulfatase-like hydrolase/transferase [Steroidobacteraceae bacterium]
MVSRHFLFSLLLTLISAESASSAPRPNILFILGDDVGWGDIRTNNPDGQVSLPTIERLASEGISFTDAHTSAAKCAPSRYSLITGNYQWRGRKAWGTWEYKGGSQILPGQETMGELLKRAGYTTAFIGKYHLGADFYKTGSSNFASESDLDTAVDFARAMVNGPGNQGFDYSFVAMRGIQAGPYGYFENDLLFGDPSELITWQAGNYRDTRIIEAGIGLPSWNTRQVGPTLLSKAVDFIETASAVSPFFIFLSTEAVHSPRKPPVAIGDRLVGGTTGLGARADMLVEIDAVVDALLRKLEQLGILQDTLIIFTSDNGGASERIERDAGHHTSGGFRGDKGSIYEGGHRVPLIMKWGSQAFGTSSLPRGTRINTLVGAQDLYATLAELTETPVAGDQGRDSFSMLRVLMGEATAVRGHMVHEADFDAPDGAISGGEFAYRSGAWKLIFDVNRVPVGLYDLADDPFETTNRLSQPEQNNRAAAMRAGFENAMASARTAPPVGTALVTVPDVTGLSQALAESAIQDAGLDIGTVTQQGSSTVPVGSVIRQDPVGETAAPVGSPVNLVISAPAPGFSLLPTSVAFGSQALNLVSDARVVTLRNTGESTLSISSIALTGSNPGQFSQSHNCSGTQPSGSTCMISLRFRPTGTGTKTAALKVVAANGAGTKQVALSGTGVKSVMSVSPASLSFGNQARRTISAAKVVTISNSGAVVLPISSIKFEGTNPQQFKQTNNCPAQVFVGESCIANVTFNPTSKGAKSAALKITAGGGAGAKSVTLTGNGT